MAFVSIDNPAGIQHHGGQMDWCRISPTRIALLTYTQDNKALLQEINYVDGATVVGTPTFLKAVPAGGPTYRHLRSFVRDMGAGRLFVMVPIAFVTMVSGAAQASPCAYVGLSAPTAIAAAVGTPVAWTCMTLQRNSDGTYTVDSSIDINMTITSDNTKRETRGAPIDIGISATTISVKSLLKNSASNRYFNNFTLTLTAGKLTAQSSQFNAVINTSFGTVMSVKDRRTPTGDVVKVYGYGVTTSFTTASESWTTFQGLTSARLIQNPYTVIADSPVPATGASNAPIGMMINPTGWLPISSTDPANSLLVGGTPYFSNGVLTNYLNGNQTDAGVEMTNPLDAAWVTDTVACIVGVPSKYGVQATMNYPILPGDIPFALHPDYGTQVGAAIVDARKLVLSFRNVAGAGLYVGPFDPIDLGYYARLGQNEGDMIHRISDSAFWLIGCFMDSPTADPKLGVITVKA